MNKKNIINKKILLLFFIITVFSCILFIFFNINEKEIKASSYPISSKGNIEIYNKNNELLNITIKSDEIQYITDLSNKLNSDYNSIANNTKEGKQLLISALKAKGIELPSNATFDEINNAIKSIKTEIIVGVDRLPGEIEYERHKHTANENNGRGCYSTPIYHRHSGNSNGGGCYTVPHTGTTTVNCGGCNCNVGPYGPDTSGQVYYVGNCSGCGKTLSVYGSPGWANCDNNKTTTYTYYTPGCGKNESTIEGYALGCGLKENQITGAHIIYN